MNFIYIKRLLLSILFLLIMGCNSLTLVEASRYSVSASRPGLKSKMTYSFNVKVNNPITINKVVIGGYNTSKEVAIYNLPSGQIIPLGESMTKGNYNLTIKLDKSKAKELLNTAVITFTSSGKTEELEVTNIIVKKNILAK